MKSAMASLKEARAELLRDLSVYPHPVPPAPTRIHQTGSMKSTLAVPPPTGTGVRGISSSPPCRSRADFTVQSLWKCRIPRLSRDEWEQSANGKGLFTDSVP
ncbi:hypothetical protein NDU88_002952 [Pleurodeles waltl]|uniref:Uncharacterized protein n=1 Tax=Pleurodeles waltl TaxID=8319 RepID=A0AAV7UAQ4_PLEWA|nr:hypothetical protein NDU88_002952 [Pleurodeles waltl]